ncbi:bacterio-opsin activator domain-containing protein [Haloarchaeobius sp. HME9146]|uniref:bacterio-opsin activator domain-containing protein n=1 Tax=Haloarchaeobius sp. HME9146 TaxID=2978732 RepID=UPI0021C0D2DA|nr:bacterio-opsin activator domain-containing protein [Haloarchaeobius sp. HME9146]MCT9098300.1 helix-turn-helix domain-containing protein [Haloarchaeobius sp. HME9146]
MSPGQHESFLTDPEFERLRHATETYREDLVVSLAGLVGLRPAEMARLRPGDLTQRTHHGRTHHLLTVRETETDATQPADAATRLAYVPATVAHDLRKFANVEGVAADEPLFGVSPRRLQMLVSDVADRTDDERLQSVSSKDLRKHFAHRSLNAQGVPAPVVQAVGGWNSLESLDQYLDTPSAAAIVEAFARGSTGLRQGGAPPVRHDSRHTPATADHHQTPSRTAELVHCVEALGEALADVATREEVETAACNALADFFGGVWLCDGDGTPRERAGTLSDQLSDEELGEAIAGQDLESRLADGSDDALVLDSHVVDELGTGGDETLCIVAIRSGETVDGLLCVATRSADRETQRVLADAGRRIGRTLTAVDRKRLLLADTGVELAFECTDRSSFLVDTATVLECDLELEGVVPGNDGSLLHFVTVEGAGVGDVLEHVDGCEAVTDSRLVRDYGEHALLEFVVSGDAIAPTLVERGGTVRSLTVEGGTARVTSVFSDQTDLRTVVESFTASFPDAKLLAKREVEQPVQTTAQVEQVVDEDLTEKQRTVLRAAFLSGYFEWPRGSTAEELAASMDISSPTLHNHLRKAQQKLLTAVFEDSERPADGRH